MHSGNKYYVLTDAYPFTFLTPRDSFMSMVEPGAHVKINWDKKDLYVWAEDKEPSKSKWWLTIDVVDNYMMEKLEEIVNR
jgi:hypothetical protein